MEEKPTSMTGLAHSPAHRLPLRRAALPRLAVGAVMYRYSSGGKLQIALIKKRGGDWTLPKGHVEGDETEAQALHRELREEVDVDGSIEGLLREVQYDVLKRRGVQYKVVRYFLVRAAAGKLRPNRGEGIRRARWVAPSEALQRLHNDRVRDVLERAIIGLLAAQSG
jgi:8-oxo-dGTP diphosphatase